MGTKIQINDKKALDRLIGDDSEFELELKNAVVKEILKNHLKPKIYEWILPEITKEMLWNFFEKARYGAIGAIKPDIKKAIIDQIKQDSPEIIREVVQECISKEVKLDLVKESVLKAIEYVENELQQKTLDSTIDKLVDSKIRQKLGL